MSDLHRIERHLLVHIGYAAIGLLVLSALGWSPSIVPFYPLERSASYDAFGVALQSTDTLYIARRGTSHVGDNGELSLWRHDGIAWSRSTLVDDATYDDRNPGGGVVSTGTLLVFYTRYNAGTTVWNDIRVLRSTDNGTNWTDVGAIATGTDTAFSPYGPLVEMPGGVLMQTFYGDDGTTNRVWVQFSTDDGLTWGSEVVVASSATLEITEAAAVFLDGTEQADSRLVLVTRDNAGVMRQYRSSDGGATWADQGTLSFSVGTGTDVSPWLYKDGSTLYLLYAKRSTKTLERYVADGDVHTDKANWSFDETLWTSVTTVTGDFGYPSEAGGNLFFYDQFDGKTDLYSTIFASATMPFDYSTIFAGAEAGDAWLADGSHFQDSGRTTAAAADDPIGSATGDAGNFNAQQTGVDTLKPTLRQDAGGKWYFDFDGGDSLNVGAASDWVYLHSDLSAYICFSARFGIIADPEAFYPVIATFLGSQAQTGFCSAWDDRSSVGFKSNLRILVGNASGFQPADLSGLAEGAQTDVVFELIKTGFGSDDAHFAVWINGVEIAHAYATDLSSANPASLLTIGRTGSAGSAYLIGNLYGLLVTDTIPSAANRIAIRQDMAERCITNPLKVNGAHTASVTLTLNDPASGGAAWASKTGLAVDISVDRDSAPFYSATGQSTNGSGELAIAATGCPLAAGTQTVWIRITDSDGLAGGIGNDSNAFYAPVSVTVA